MYSKEGKQPSLSSSFAQTIPVEEKNKRILPTIIGKQTEITERPRYSNVAAKVFEEIDVPWQDWSKCDPQSAFEAKCHPRPASCQSTREDVLNSHGLGHSLLHNMLPLASELLMEKPECAPILHDKLHFNRTLSKKDDFMFRLLDYVQEPTVVVDGNIHVQGSSVGSHGGQNGKCIIYSITQPRLKVAEKVQIIKTNFHEHSANNKDYPLVAIHIRTGWSDEMGTTGHAWGDLGSCDDYKEQFPMSMAHHGVAAVDLEVMLMDTAAAADHAFGGTRQWRLYVASDAPGIRNYVKHILDDRTIGPIVWHVGSIGHNSKNSKKGLTSTLEEKIDTSVSAFTDLIVMSEADMLIALRSKFPVAAHTRSAGCPQRFAQLQKRPYTKLALSGSLLRKAWHADRPHKNSNSTAWSPNLSEDSKKSFFHNLPGGMDNPCTKAVDPIRACYCLLKLSHN